MNHDKKLIKQGDLYYLAVSENHPCTCPFAAVPVIPVRTAPSEKVLSLNGNNDAGITYEPQYLPCSSSCPHFNVITTPEGKTDLLITCGGQNYIDNMVVESEKKDGL